MKEEAVLSTHIRPTGVLQSLMEVPHKDLIKSGIRFFFIDCDNTAVPHGGRKVCQVYDQRLNEICEDGGIICLASNNPQGRRNFTTAPYRIFQPSSNLDWLLCRKPYRSYYQRALQFMGASPRESVMIGDKYGRDVNGALRAGFAAAYLVMPMGDDLFFDRLTRLREREARILREEFWAELPPFPPQQAA